jgi:hypothetical protein
VGEAFAPGSSTPPCTGQVEQDPARLALRRTMRLLRPRAAAGRGQTRRRLTEPQTHTHPRWLRSLRFPGAGRRCVARRRRDYVSHVVHDHTSILKLVETKWNLPALTYRDASAVDLPGPVPDTAQVAGTSERAWRPVLPGGSAGCDPRPPGRDRAGASPSGAHTGRSNIHSASTASREDTCACHIQPQSRSRCRPSRVFGRLAGRSSNKCHRDWTSRTVAPARSRTRLPASGWRHAWRSET